ncbi:MAG: 2-isopropylmalate synthase, partial [Candidatus Odinarchaeia archaeon]
MFFSFDKLPEKVLIFDTTLRDGEQTPGVALTLDKKIEIAHLLDELKVDVIEAGFPISSEGEAEAVRTIAKEKLSATICGLARTTKEDIDKCIECEVDRIHTFIATSDIHMKHKLGMTPEEVVDKAVWAVEYAKDHGVEVEFSAEDATRTRIDFLKEIFSKVTEAGASYLDIPDTVGVA